MPWCAICFTSLQNNDSIVKLPCHCVSCSDCLTSWIATQATELHYQTHEKIPCMIATCKQPFEIKLIFDQLTEGQQNMVNDILFDVYLKKTEDIRKCPNNNCSYAGIIDPSMSCRNNLECGFCGGQWREKLHYTTTEKVKEFILNGNTQKNEIMSDFWQEAFTRRCPKCNVHIQKNGGCNHMTCKKCQYEFCWLCFQQHQKHNRKVCAYSCLTKTLVLAQLVFNFLWLTGIGPLMLSIIIWIEKFVVGSVLIYLMIFFLYLFCKQVQKRRNIKFSTERKQQAELVCFGLFGAAMFCLGVIKLLDLATFAGKAICLEALMAIVFKGHADAVISKLQYGLLSANKIYRHLKRNRRIIFVYIRSYFQR